MSEVKYTRSHYLRGECTHEQYYSQFVIPAVTRAVVEHIGIVRLTTSEDSHFNDIPLSLWDALSRSTFVVHKVTSLLHAAGDYPTQAGMVCILKQAARMLVNRMLSDDADNQPESDVQTSENGVQSQESVLPEDSPTKKRFTVESVYHPAGTFGFDDYFTACEQAVMLHAETVDSNIYVRDNETFVHTELHECYSHISVFQDTELVSVSDVQSFCSLYCTENCTEEDRLGIYLILGLPADKVNEFPILFVEYLPDNSIGHAYGIRSNLIYMGYPVLNLRLYYNLPA